MLARGMRRAVGGLGTAPMALAVGNRNLSWLPGLNIGSPHVLQELAERTGHIPSVLYGQDDGAGYRNVLHVVPLSAMATGNREGRYCCIGLEIFNSSPTIPTLPRPITTIRR